MKLKYGRALFLCYHASDMVSLVVYSRHYSVYVTDAGLMTDHRLTAIIRKKHKHTVLVIIFIDINLLKVSQAKPRTHTHTIKQIVPDVLFSPTKPQLLHH